MSHVACVCSAPIVGEARARGLDPTVLIAGLELSVADLEDPRGRIPWLAFVIFAQRAAKMLGTETLEELAADATFDSVPNVVRRILPGLADSRPLFTFAARWWGPWIFHGTRGRCEVLPDGRLREIVRILPGYAPCPEFLSGIQGTLRGMPRLLGQPDAIVTLEQDGREGEYLITPPPRRGKSRKAPRFDGKKPSRRVGWRMRRELARGDRAQEELDTAQKQLLESQRSAQQLSDLLEQQSRRLDTLQQLGLILVRDGAVDTLPRGIVRLVQERLGIGGVRLLQYGEEGGSMRGAVSGSLAGTPVEVLALRIADRRIGRLELWGVEEDALVPLLEIVPWIAFALEYGGSKARVAQLVGLLGEDLRDWERMERRLAQLVAEQSDDSSPRATVAVDLAGFLHALAPRLRQQAGDDVRLALHCSDGLRAALPDGSRLDSFLESVVEILCDIGSEEIWIETRPVAARGSAAVERSNAEILVWGRGGEMDAISRSRLRTALEICDTDGLVTDLDVHSEPSGAVGVRVDLPLLAPARDGRAH